MHTFVFIVVFVILFLCSAFSAHAGAIMQVPFNVGLVGYWPMDEIIPKGVTIVKDKSGRGNDGTINGNPRQVSGQVGNALDFDGTDDEVNLGNPSTLQIVGSMSVAIWANRETNPANVTNMLSKRTTGSPGTRQFYLHVSDANPDKVQFAVTNSNTDYTATSITTMPASTWIHVVGVYDSVAETVKIYINGALEATAAGPASITPQNTIDAAIGSRGGSATNLFTGILDEARVYNRALSAQEIQRLYVAGRNKGYIIQNRIIFGAASSVSGSNVSSLSFSHTVSKRLSNQILLVGVSDQDGTASDRQVSSITYNGIGLNQIRADEGGNGTRTELWYGVNPTRGTNTVEVTFAGPGAVSDAIAGAVSLGGVDGKNPIDAQNGTSGTGSPGASVSLATVKKNSWIIDSFVVDAVVGTEAGREQSRRWLLSTTAITGGGSTREPMIENTSATMSWPFSNGSWVHSAVSLRPMRLATINSSPIRDVTNGLVGYWTFDGKDLSPTTAADRSGFGKHGILFSNPMPTIGRVGQGLIFNGVASYVDAGDVSGSLQGVAFWIKADTTTQKIIDLNGTASIEAVSGTVTANGFTSPKIFVDGIVQSTITTSWHHVVVLTDTAINANTVTMGKIGSGFFAGKLDDVRIYNAPISDNEVKRLYNKGR